MTVSRASVADGVGRVSSGGTISPLAPSPAFAPFEMITGTAAPELVRFAGVGPGAKVLDVGCGTGVVALTCARRGAIVTGADLTPELLERAREPRRVTDHDERVGRAQGSDRGDTDARADARRIAERDRERRDHVARVRAHGAFIL